MRPSSRRFFFLDAFLFSFRPRLSPRSDETFLYRPTFANIARRALFLDIQVHYKSRISRARWWFLEANVFCRGRIQSPFSIARGREMYIADRLISIGFVMKSQCAETRKRGGYRCRGEKYEYARAKTYTRNVSFTHNISFSKIIITHYANGDFFIQRGDYNVGDRMLCEHSMPIYIYIYTVSLNLYASPLSSPHSRVRKMRVRCRESSI